MKTMTENWELHYSCAYKLSSSYSSNSVNSTSRSPVPSWKALPSPGRDFRGIPRIKSVDIREIDKGELALAQSLKHTRYEIRGCRCTANCVDITSLAPRK